MTYNKLIKECMEIYTTHKEKDNKADMKALNTIIKLHNTLNITDEATTWLWANYLANGDIDIMEALRITNIRKKVEVN